MLRPLVILKASISQPVFGRLLHPVVFSHGFSFFFPVDCYMHNFRNFELWKVPVAKTFSSILTWVQCQLLLFKRGRSSSEDFFAGCACGELLSLCNVWIWLLCVCDVVKGFWKSYQCLLYLNLDVSLLWLLKCFLCEVSQIWFRWF